MKLIGSKYETEVRPQLLSSLSSFKAENTEDQLMRFVHKRYPNAYSAMILHWIPEQGEDIFTVLVNDNIVVDFEIPKNSSHCDQYVVGDEVSVFDYEKKRSKRERIKLAVALDLAKKEKLKV